ncbi:MAG: ABC transporter permease [Lachnospiraceae bacterium]|nr:ABC transporter permease [Lachnospiraceae bacterium]
MGAILKNDFRLLWSGKRAGIVIALVLLLVVGAALVSWLPQEQNAPAGERVRIGVVNQDESLYAQMIVGYFTENPVFTAYVSVIIDEEDTIRQQFDAGELDMYMVIPKDFADSMVYLEHLPIQTYISTASTTKALLLKNLMESYVEYITAVEVNCVALYDAARAIGLPKTTAQTANEKLTLELILLIMAKDNFFEKQVVENYTAVRLVPYYLHEFCYLLAAFLALLAGVRFQREHHAGIYRRLAAMGHSAAAILLEKQFFYMLLLTLLFAVLWGALGVAGVTISVAAFGYFCLNVWFLCALMLCLAAAFQKLQNYLLASNMVILLGAILGGGLLPLMYLPENMEKIAQFMPNYWFLKQIFEIENGVMKQEQYIVFGCFGVAILLLLVIGAVIYRKKEGRVYENA